MVWRWADIFSGWCWWLFKCNRSEANDILRKEVKSMNDVNRFYSECLLWSRKVNLNPQFVRVSLLPNAPACVYVFKYNAKKNWNYLFVYIINALAITSIRVTHRERERYQLGWFVDVDNWTHCNWIRCSPPPFQHSTRIQDVRANAAIHILTGVPRLLLQITARTQHNNHNYGSLFQKLFLTFPFSTQREM